MGKGRKPCCDKAGVKKGPWSQAEDFKLITFIQKYGHNNWRALPKLAGLARCGKSCRLRWVNYLRPDLKRGNFTPQEEEAIIKLHEALGNKWSKIASHFPGRTDNEIKNVWNTHLKKRLKNIGSNDDNSQASSCNEQSINTTILDNKDSDESKEANCFEQSLVNQGTTNNDVIEYSSSSSTSYNSISDHLMVDDLNPSMIENGVVECKNETNIFMEKKNENSQDEVIEIPFEPNLDLWDLLHGENEVQFKDVDTAISKIYNNNDTFQNDGGSWWWLVYLENELGLEHQKESTPLQSNNNVTSSIHDLCSNIFSTS